MSAADRASLPTRLAAFAALALFAGLHWATLVAAPPGARVLAVVAVVTAGAALLTLAPPRVPARVRTPLAALIAVLTVVAGSVAAGLSPRLLGPRRWDDLFDGLDRGFAGLRTASWPYDGAEEWVRLTLLLLVPLVVAAAAAVAFWPSAAGRTARRLAALALLVGLFVAADAERTFEWEVLRGVVLLALVAGWLWLPRVRRRDAFAAAGAVALAAVAAVPVAARVDPDRPLLDYESWGLWGDRTRAGLAFDWEHSYGPIGWARTGARVLTVRSERPHYWKVKTLELFDGLRWRDRELSGTEAMELPPPAQRERRWQHEFSVTVRGLRGQTVPGAGTVLGVDGLGPARRSIEGTVRLVDGELEKGDSYTVRAYVPNPSAAQMRAAPDPAIEMELFTRLTLPAPGETALSRVQLGQHDRTRIDAGEEEVAVGLYGGAVPLDLESEQMILDSPYARTYRLARRLADGESTVYDAVRRIERHLREQYTYTELPPVRAYPLEGFLFNDRTGYCQQFSGAMALMLRMNGIPARVATGFSPGIEVREQDEYRVRDFDAHSWVEVHFAGIGWVPFDPTPAAAPAELQAADVLSDDAASASSPGRGGDSARAPDVDTGDGGRRAEDATAGSGPGGWLLAAAGALAAALSAWAVAVVVSRRRLAGLTGVDRDVAELRAALVQLGYAVPPGETLIALERRLGSVAGPGAARYLRRLRERRYAPPGRGGPDRLDRRALRRALTHGGGPLRRLRGFLALPPTSLGPGR